MRLIPLLRVKPFSIILITALSLLFKLPASGQCVPLLNGFAHNDYWHKHPLFDALNNGYTNVEADVYLHKGQLVVTHLLPVINHHRTLEKLYLKPLYDYVNQNDGKVYQGYDNPVTLMIDIKSDANKTYAVLKPLLEKYRSLLSGYKDGRLVMRPVRVVLSGHKPYDMLRGDKDRLAFIDEDLRKITRDTSDKQNMFSMASCKYSKLLKWKGTGLLSTQEKQKLCAYVRMAHHCGAKVRLWASPDNKIVWRQLLQCGVDLINTDNLVRLRNFLTADQVSYTVVAN